MNHASMSEGVRYLTNEAGEKTDVLVPLDMWKKILDLIGPTSGLDPIDEQEPISQILADLKTAVHHAQSGETYPISELWNDIDV